MVPELSLELTLTPASLPAPSTVTNDFGAGLPRLTGNPVSQRGLQVGIFQIRSNVKPFGTIHQDKWLQAKTVWGSPVIH